LKCKNNIKKSKEFFLENLTDDRCLAPSTSRQMNLTETAAKYSQMQQRANHHQLIHAITCVTQKKIFF